MKKAGAIRTGLSMQRDFTQRLLNFRDHLSETFVLGDADGAGSTRRQIEHAAFDVRSAVVDCDDNAAALTAAAGL